MRSNETFQNTQFLRSMDVMDIPVKNTQGENLRRIEDLVVDVETGRVAYAVLSWPNVLDRQWGLMFTAITATVPTGNPVSQSGSEG